MKRSDEWIRAWEKIPERQVPCPKLKTVFSVNGALVPDIPDNLAGIVPQEPCFRLYLEQGKRRRRVDQLSQLRGQVTITSPKAALDFVRLRTSEETWLMLMGIDGGWAEVLPTSRGGGLEGWHGTCSPRTFAKLGLTSTSVQTSAEGFLVRRNIVRHQDYPKRRPITHLITTIYALEERVTPEGDYKVLTAKRREFTPGALGFLGFIFIEYQ